MTPFSGGRDRRIAPPQGVQGTEGALRIDGNHRETVLDNGVRVLSERMPGLRSIAVGIWIRQGTAHEPEPSMGVSHLLEHMVFKGTERRSAHEIALALESLGGSLDAYTSREHTSFQARVLDEHLGEALDVLADLVCHPALRARDLDLEREVVLEEIAEVDDTPDDLVHDLHGQLLWGEHSYGFPILGTRDTVGGMPVEALREMHSTRYVGRNLVVAATGNVDHDDLVARVDRLLGHLEPGARTSAPADPRPATGRREVVGRDTAQAHLVAATATVPHSHPMRLPLILVSQAFGGGMSSRLFQRIREEMGLVYTVYSFQSFLERSGLIGVYLGTRPEWLGRAEEALRDEFRRMAEGSLGHDELERTRTQVKGQVTLSLESPTSRLYRLAGTALHDEPWLDADQLLARVDAVTADQVAEAAATWLDPDRQLTLVLGPETA